MKIEVFKNEKWKLPSITNNFYLEIDFGKISIYICRGKNFKDIAGN